MKILGTFFKGALLFGALIIADIAIAQCDAKKFRKMTKEGLGQYIFETASSKAFNEFAEPRKMIDAAFSVYAQENYRVLNLCDGFTSPVEFTVYDSDKKQIFTNASDLTKTKFDFTAEKTGDYIIRFKFTEAQNPNACVSFCVGYR